MIKQLVYILLVFFFCLPIGTVASTLDSTKVEAWDSASVDYRPASKEKMETYKQMKDYNYERFEKPESLWDKFMRWLSGKIGNSTLNQNLILYGLIGFSVLVFLFVILKLLGVEITGLFVYGHKNKAAQLLFKQQHDDIYSNNMEQMLHEAINGKAYREAVRLLYLLSLRQLDALELIRWQPWKTNKDYYYELVVAEHKHQFSALQLSYEYIWYGQFKVEEEKFNEVQAQFKLFENALSSNKIGLNHG